jgi:hypothetical protein
MFYDKLLRHTLKYAWPFPLESNLRTAYNKKIQLHPVALLAIYSIFQKVKYFKKIYCTITIIPEIYMKPRHFRCHITTIDELRE